MGSKLIYVTLAYPLDQTTRDWGVFEIWDFRVFGNGIYLYVIAFSMVTKLYDVGYVFVNSG